MFPSIEIKDSHDLVPSIEIEDAELPNFNPHAPLPISNLTDIPPPPGPGEGSKNRILEWFYHSSINN